MSALHFDGGTLELKLPFLPDLQLRWQDLLDIVLLTLIFYRLLILIKGTRTNPMLMGFSLLLALYVVALLLDLNATQLLLDNFCLLYTSPSPRDQRGSRMPSSA